jgi:hypothetical protein
VIRIVLGTVLLLWTGEVRASPTFSTGEKNRAISTRG